MTDPPLIGILCGRSPEERYSTHRGYVSSVTAIGGVPLLIPAGPDVDAAAMVTLVSHCRGIIVTGGGDVDPEHYSGEHRGPSDLLMDVDPNRDITEMAVVQFALAQHTRVLGICRGAQLLAVMGGGTLIHDLPEKGLDGHWDEVRQHEPVHAIATEAGSLADQVLGSVDQVNSIHHQAIADPGQTLRATAWSPDGVIEAVEGPGLLGLQWHPERLTATDPRHLAPFAWMLGA